LYRRSIRAVVLMTATLQSTRVGEENGCAAVRMNAARRRRAPTAAQRSAERRESSIRGNDPAGIQGKGAGKQTGERAGRQRGREKRE
jgi:hypothetical protein